MLCVEFHALYELSVRLESGGEVGMFSVSLPPFFFHVMCAVCAWVERGCRGVVGRGVPARGVVCPTSRPPTAIRSSACLSRVISTCASRSSRHLCFWCARRMAQASSPCDVIVCAVVQCWELACCMGGQQ